MSRGCLVAAILFSCLGSSGAATAEEASAPGEDGTAFTARVEKVIASQGDLGRGRLWRRLTGRKDSPLFHRPYAVVWQGEDLLVTDPGAGQVLRIRPGGKVIRSPQGLLQSPVGIAICAEGILVTDSILGKLALLDEDLQLRSWLIEGLERPSGVGCLGDRVFVAETGRHRILAIGPADPISSAAQEAPWTDHDSSLLVAEDQSIRALGRRGDKPSEFNFPTVVGVGLGSVWIGDALNFRLQRLQPDTGEILGAFGRLGDSAGEMPRLKGLTFDSDGRLWVSDAYLNQIALYRDDGTYLMSVGRPGSRPGEFNFPAGIATHPGGRTAVVDSLNRRLQILQLVAMRNPE